MKRFSEALLFFQRDIGVRLFVFYLLFIGPLIIGALYVNNIARQRLEREVRTADQDLADVVSKEFNSYLSELTEMIDQLAHHSAVVNFDPGGIAELFQTVSIGRPNISVLYVLDNDCRTIYDHRPGIGNQRSGITLINIQPLCEYDGTTPVITRGHISPISRQPVATIAHPIFSLIEGKTIGWVAVDVRLNALNELAKLSVQHRPDEGIQVIILDGEGMIIARSDFNSKALLIDAAIENPSFSSAVIDDTFTNWIAPTFAGNEHLYTSTLITDTDWRVLLGRPTEIAFSTPQAFNRGVIISVFLFIAVGLFFWLMLYSNVIRPLERLAIHSRDVAQENRLEKGGLHINVGRPDRNITQLLSRKDQIGHLVNSLLRADEMIAARFKELETLLETGAVVLSSLDLRVVLKRILEQVERLMGLNMSAIIALDEKRGVFLSQASHGLSQRYTEQIVIHPGEPASITLKAIETGHAIQVANTEMEDEYAAYQPRAKSEGIKAMIAVPLNLKHGPPTALLVYHNEPHEFSPREISLLTSFAQQAAMALENATLFNRSDVQLQEQTLRLVALIQSMRDGLIMEDLEGHVIYVNRMAEDLTGLTQFQAAGKHVDELIERILLLTREPEKTRAAIRNAQDQKENTRVDLEITDLTGKRYFLRMRNITVTDETGTMIGRGRIFHDITRRREIDRMRTSLVSTVSHELRTPLASIKGFATTLLSDDVEWDTVSQREFLAIISQETDRLSELVKDLLDMSRIEAGNLSISRVSTNLSEMIALAAHRARTPPGDRLVVDISPEVPDMYIDPQRMEVVFRNLIENAVKYSEDDTPIRVSVGRDTDSIIIRVEDEGLGIPHSEQRRIFESFYRVENGLSRSTPGAGLGLAICQGFVRAHGGRIWYEEREKGSCFIFSLPLEIRNEKVRP